MDSRQLQILKKIFAASVVAGGATYPVSKALAQTCACLPTGKTISSFMTCGWSTASCGNWIYEPSGGTLGPMSNPYNVMLSNDSSYPFSQGTSVVQIDYISTHADTVDWYSCYQSSSGNSATCDGPLTQTLSAAGVHQTATFTETGWGHALAPSVYYWAGVITHGGFSVGGFGTRISTASW